MPETLPDALPDVPPDTSREPTDAEAGQRIRAVRSLFDRHATMALSAVSDGEPWIAKVFFVDDEPAPGRMDLCAGILATSGKLAMLRAHPRAAFLVASDTPDRWAQGVGDAQVIDDQGEADMVAKALFDKCDAAQPFLSRVDWRAVRLHVRRLKYTDVLLRPPVAEFRFDVD